MHNTNDNKLTEEVASAETEQENSSVHSVAGGEAEQTDGNKNPSDETAENHESVERLTLYKRPKRNGKFLSKLSQKELDALQKRKSLFMYLSTLLFAVSLFLKVEGRDRLANMSSWRALFTLYLIALIALIALTVYVAVMGRTGQKIGSELKESNVPRDGLNKHTFVSYEFFNVLHVLVAAAEIVISVIGFGSSGAFDIFIAVCNIIVSAGSAVCCVLSRQVLFKANAGNLEYLPAREEDEKPQTKKKKRREKE